MTIEKEYTNPPMSTDEAAAYLKTAVGTLENWRIAKTGPRYYKPGGKRVLYYKDDLDAWIRGETNETTRI